MNMALCLLNGTIHGIQSLAPGKVKLNGAVVLNRGIAIAQVLEYELLVWFKLSKHLGVHLNELPLQVGNLFPVTVLGISFYLIEFPLSVMHAKEEIEQQPYIWKKNKYSYPRKCFYRILTAHNHCPGSIHCQKQVHDIENRRDYLPSVSQHYSQI